MKIIVSIISSTRTMAVLLFIFTFSIALATFIENDYGTEGARSVVYNALWFEMLMLFGAVNVLAVILRNKLYRRGKLTLFIFHAGFIVVVLGAGITRYFGREGIMHIREGQTAGRWLTTQTYINVQLENKGISGFYSYPVLFSSISGNRFNHSYSVDDRSLKISMAHFFPHAEKVLTNDPDGKPFLHLVSTGDGGRENFMVTIGESFRLGNKNFSFISTDSSKNLSGSVNIILGNDSIIYVKAPFDVTQTAMANQSVKVLRAGEPHRFNPMMLYNFNGTPVVLRQYMAKAKISAQPVDDKQALLPSAIVFNILCDGMKQSITVWGRKEVVGLPESIIINDIKILVNYGANPRQLPFSLRLNDFIIKRYPGSESPSWYESKVQLIDSLRNINSESRIYMNHILKNRGYRFYQASYDPDEGGTVLSLNRDWWGTTITYIGYLMLAIGMALSLMNRNSRFRKLSFRQMARKGIHAGFILCFLFISTCSFGQDGPEKEMTDRNMSALPIINKNHAEAFGKILVQDNGGRIEPLNTLSSEVLRKVSRKDIYNDQTPDQVLLGMLVFPQAWQQESMIRVANPEIQKILGINSKYASFNNFFSADIYSGYVLKPYVEEAYRKKPAYRNKFDNEVIRTDERLNICYLVYTGSLLKIFPNPDDTANKWYSPNSAPGVYTTEDSVFTNHVLNFYFGEVSDAVQSGKWQLPDQLVQSIYAFQAKYGAQVIPKKARIQAEILYNQSNIFARLTNVYLLVGLLLLLVQFIHIFIPRFNIRKVSTPTIVLITLTFVLHTLGLALRWYVSDHAPWSNGYEALTFIAWATVLAGLIYSRKSSITISATAVLAALILQTAHLSWMDPQVTNLVPVLKSYWLVIHVAVITASYGFLGLGALLAAFNLLLMFFESEKNQERLETQIILLSRIIEMALISGLYLLTIGTFLGGVWANESWGRYWAWDPKETWALITVIVYAFILHMRIVKGLKGRLLFNILSLMGFASVIMTYFGVNYYLSGLHSYAKGDPLPVPPIVYYSVASVLIVSILAVFNQLKLKKATELIKVSETEE